MTLALSLCQSGNEEEKEGLKSYANVPVPFLHYCCKTFLGLEGGGLFQQVISPSSTSPCPPNRPFYYQRKMQKWKKIRDDDDCRFPIACCKKIEVKRNS